jgi:hypothetical protein
LGKKQWGFKLDNSEKLNIGGDKKIIHHWQVENEGYPGALPLTVTEAVFKHERART